MTPANISRRGLFVASGAVGLALIAGCNPFSTAAETVTITTQAPPPTSALMGLMFKTRLHMDHLAAAVHAGGDNADLFAQLLTDRQAHMDALAEENIRIGGDPDLVPPPAAIDAIDVPEDPADLLALLRDDAGQSQNSFTDALMSASPYEAQLFSSIAACVATHRSVLA